MREDQEDHIRLIKKSEYIPELEEKVKYYIGISPELPEIKKKHVRATPPIFKNSVEKERWEREQIRRCINGYDGMSRKMYFYFNFGWIENISGGKIKPEYRACDQEWFKLLTDCHDDGDGWGIVCVKRRRVGASWKEASDVLHDCLFNSHYHVGMNSKSEKDSIVLFKKVKFLYNSLPDFLRVKTSASSTKMFIDFSYYTRDDQGSKKKKGNQSDIIVVAPTDSAYEGMILSKWVCDEAGKIVNLPQLWSYTEDCMMEEHRRVGLPVLFGTSGDIGKDGAGLKEMWDNSEVYRLRRFFFAGWMGILSDDKGNDHKEEAIRWIIYERHRRRNLSIKIYTDFIQKYPLTISEAFAQASEGGVGDIVKINAQIASLSEDPVEGRPGSFYIDKNDKVQFKPHLDGLCIVYEHPKEGKQYVAGCDPADHDDAYEGASDLSMYIISQQHGLQPPRVVFEYTDRPRQLNEYYNQSLLAVMYYNNTKLLIERNRYRMISYFSDRGFKYMLQSTPQAVLRLVGGRSNTIGMHVGVEGKEYLKGLIEEYIDEYCEYIPSVLLLREFIVYGTTNTDRASAFSMALVMLKETRRRKMSEEQIKKQLPRFKYAKINGRLQRITVD